MNPGSAGVPPAIVAAPKMSKRQINTGVLTRLLLVGTAVYGTQKAIDARVGQFRSTEEVLYMPSGRVIKALSLGHNGLLADVYWMRAVQYYGGKRLRNEKRYDLLDPLIGIATTLDPQLIHAYRFGAIFLSEPSPVGAKQPEKAIALLKQGIEHNPDEWQLYRDLGFVYYWYLEDYQKAADSFLEGSKNPKSAAWMKTFAAESLAKGGSREAARLLWQQFFETAENEQMKQNAKENLIRLNALDKMDSLQEFIRKVEVQFGRPVQSIEELLKLGLLKQRPLDPKGFSYVYDPQTGNVQLSPESTVRRF
jgi:tetratricopeptide (TPR) repeat protein